MKPRKQFLAVAVLAAASCGIFFAQDFDDNSDDPLVQAFLNAEKNSSNGEVSLEDQDEKNRYVYSKEKEYPEPKRPRKVSAEEILESASKNEEHSTEEYVKETKDTFRYGLEDQISGILDTLTKEEDIRFLDSIYDLFHETKNPGIRNKVLVYFTKIKDPCLEDYAVSIINDPYDEKKETVSNCFRYVSACGTKAACPGLIDLVEKEEEDYFNGALSALGEIGEKEEALYLADYLDRDDLSVPQRQSLMKVLGKIQAIETWEKLVEIAQDEDENSFVRMYAAESIGSMEKEESLDILVDLFESDDPNFRVYVIKGLSHFNDEKSSVVVLQALRDAHYKVRLEAVDVVDRQSIKEAVPFLIYRCKDAKEEKAVKDKCYKVLAKLDDKEGNEYLVSVINDKKAGDTTKAKVAAALMEVGTYGTDDIIALAKKTLENDVSKNLRYALGKEFAKYGRSDYAEICSLYLDHEDVSTQGTGLDIFAKGRYSSVRYKVELIAQDADIKEEENKPNNATKTYQFGKKKINANAKKAKRILEMIDNLKLEMNQVDALSGSAPKS